MYTVFNGLIFKVDKLEKLVVGNFVFATKGTILEGPITEDSCFAFIHALGNESMKE